MSVITKKLIEDKKIALRNKDKNINAIITLLLARILSANKESKELLTEAEEIAQIASELKQTRESLNEYKKAGREDLVNSTESQIKFIETYLPKQLNEEEILIEVQKVVTELGIIDLDKKAMGLIMKTINPKLKGKADGKLISKVVQEFIK